MLKVLREVVKSHDLVRGLTSKNIVKYPVQNIETILPKTFCIDEVSSGVIPVGDVKYTESLGLLGDVPENS